MTKQKSPVVVAIFVHSPKMTANEEISLRQCWNVLSSHPVHLICPSNMNVSAYTSIAPGLVIDRIDHRWLSSLRAYNRLKMTRFLYERYRDFEYMLTYELDAFVFRDELEYWCDQKWDFIGAPFFDEEQNATANSNIVPGGNSGFSLRNIQSARRVLRSVSLLRPVREVYAEWRKTAQVSLGSIALLVRQATVGNISHGVLHRIYGNEDLFWSRLIPKRFPWFKVAPYENASRFSFENAPIRLYKESQGELPFGCHKWTENHLDFWRPFIEASGHSL